MEFSVHFRELIMFPRRFTTTVAAHGAMVLKLTGGVVAASPTFTFYAATSGTLGGGAATRVVNSTVTVVGFVGSGGTLTLSGVDGGTAGGTKLLAFDYINGDFTFSNTACSNCRNTFVSVNGGTAVQVQMPISAQVRAVFGSLRSGLIRMRFRAGTSYCPDIWCRFQGSRPGRQTPSRCPIHRHLHRTFIVWASQFELTLNVYPDNE